MPNTVNQRLNIIIDVLFKGKKSAFAEKIGMNPNGLDSYTGKRSSKPGFDILVDIAKNVSEVNCEWLLLGEGEMLKAETIKPFDNEHQLDTKPNKSNDQLRKKRETQYNATNGSMINLGGVSEPTITYNASDVASLLKEIKDLQQENDKLRNVIEYLENKYEK